MKRFRVVFRLGLLLGLAIGTPVSPVAAQTTPPKESQPPAPGLRKLTGEDANHAQNLHEAIDAASSRDRWDEAIAKAEELLALRARVQGPEHFETVSAKWFVKSVRLLVLMSKEDRAAYDSANKMIEQAAAKNAQGKFTEAQGLMEKALEIRRRLLTDDHPATADGYNNLAFILKAQRKYAEAQLLFEKALQIDRRLLTDDHPDTAIMYNNLASNFSDQVKYAQAEPLYEKALEIRRRLLTDNDPDTALSYNDLAYNLNAQGKYTAAQPLFEKALEVRRRLLTDDNPATATSYNNVAFNLNSQGKYAQAQPLYEKALEIRRRLLTDNHPDTAISYNNLAYNFKVQGKFAQAQTLYEKALEIRRRRLTDNHPATATGYANLAICLDDQMKFDQAQPLHDKALEIRRRMLTDDHPDTAGSYNSLAVNLGTQGKRALAQPLFEKALQINRRMLTDDHPQTAQSYNNLAFNFAEQGKYAEAQPLFEQALEIKRHLLNENDPLTAGGYGNLASNLNARGRYVEARDRWSSAVKSLDAARLRVAFTGMERAGVKDSFRLNLAAVQARLGQPAQAWQTLEEAKGRGLLDELTARKDERLAPEERARLRELTNELERLDRLVETTPKDLATADREKRFEDLKHERELASIAFGEFQTRLVQEHGPLAGKVASLSEIQAALPADAALIAWVDIAPFGPSAADPDGEHWGVVVRPRGVPAWIPLTGTGKDGLWTKDDSALAKSVRNALGKRPGAGSSDLRPLLEELRTQRLEPLAKTLGAASRSLIVLPSYAMAGIPIDALFGPDDTRTVSYAPSASVFKYLRAQSRPDRHAGLLALGNPVYERSDKSSDPKPMPDHGLLVNMVAPGSNAATHGVKLGDVLLAYNGGALRNRQDLKPVPEPGGPVPVEIWSNGKVARRELARGKLGVVFDARPAPEAIAANRAFDKVLVAARGGDEPFKPLPGSGYEVEALARIFKADGRPTRTLLGADASEPELDRLAVAGDLGRFGFIHLATHGVIDEDVPLRSAVILTQAGLPDPLEQARSNKPVFDGRLSVREIQRGWELKAELVTLSACQTALGRGSGGEGFVGFTQALLMSGTRSVCLSLWEVDDTATALLMQRFYANLLGPHAAPTGPMPKAEALREAKAWLRGLSRAQVLALTAKLSGGVERGKGAPGREPDDLAAAVPAGGDNDRPYASPHFWAAFVLAGDPD